MDSDVATGLTSMLGTVKTGVTSTYLYILPALVAFILAVFAIKFGWSKIWRVSRGGH
jgi:hypothetical protein